MSKDILIVMCMAAIAAHVIQGMIEGMVVNWRTRNSRPDMGHVVTLSIRFLVCATLTYLAGATGFWRFIGLMLVMAALGAPAHRLVFNIIRSSSYRVVITDMGRDWYDSIWMGLAGGVERTAFYYCTIIELLFGISLLIVILKNLPS